MTEDHLPPDSGCVTHASGDIDGDKRLDQARVWAQVRERRPQRWALSVFLATDEEIRHPLHGTAVSYPMLIGATDVDDDGDDELIVKVGDHLYHGGGQAAVSIFLFGGGGLVQARLGDEPLRLRVGGLTQWGEGVGCRDVTTDGTPELAVYRVETKSHSVEHWRWSARYLMWRGARLRMVERRSGTISPSSYTDPQLRRFYQLRCGDFDPPYPY